MVWIHISSVNLPTANRSATAQKRTAWLKWVCSCVFETEWYSIDHVWSV